MSLCIEHTQKGNAYGYGNGRLHGKNISLHRQAYLRHHGLEPDAIAGKVVRHKCDNSRCINPEHLEIGTHADNIRDRVERGRNAKAQPAVRKVSSEQAEFIRKAYIPRHPEFSQRALARRFGVAQFVVRSILNGKTHFA